MSWVGQSLEYYYNENFQVLEVRRSGSANPLEQYVYDQRYIDAPVMVYRDTDIDGLNIQKLYVTQDANFNVTATVDGSTGTVINRFIYTPYGQRTVLTATWTAGTTDFMLGHQGLMLDGETGMYYNRARYYHPTLGRFIQRDPLGYVDGGSLYQYVRSGPVNRVDPEGLAYLVVSGPGNSLGGHAAIMVQDSSGRWIVYSSDTGGGDLGFSGAWSRYSRSGYFYGRYPGGKTDHVLIDLGPSFRDSDIIEEVERRMRDEADDYWARGGKLCSNNAVSVLLKISSNARAPAHKFFEEWESSHFRNPNQISDELERLKYPSVRIGFPLSGAGSSSSSSSSGRSSSSNWWLFWLLYN